VDKRDQNKLFTQDDARKAISRLTDLIRLQILQSPLPANVSVLSLQNGQVTLLAKNEFIITLTLGKKEVSQHFLVLTVVCRQVTFGAFCG
jgi:hypothetical protein